MNAILGIFFHSIGGFASGSFYMPYNKVKGWAWESFWIIGGLFSWLIVPPLAAWLTIPHFGAIIAACSIQILTITFIMGLLWGIGGLTYGLGVRYLGMSLGNSVVLGFCAAFGAIVPPIYYAIFPTAGKISFTDMLASQGGQLVLIGVVVCLIGIAISGKAGMMKESELTKEQQKASVAEFSLVKGLIIAVFSGVLSSFMNFGIEAGKPMAHVANEAWKVLNPGQGEFLYQNNVTYIVILWGGLTTNLIWTTILSLKNKSYYNFTDRKTPITRNLIFCAFAGTTWFLQFFFYGMGESKLGNGASSWILHMSTIILTANLWGIYRKEWKGVAPKTKWTITAGITLIIISVIIVGVGNSM
jgi:L-rhamnose-H+ transport protein